MSIDVQQRTRLDISMYLLSCYEDYSGDFIERVVTQDKKWVHHVDPESKKAEQTIEEPLLNPF